MAVAQAAVAAPSTVADNHLARQFDPAMANQAWVTDITDIRTRESWLYLAVVLDLFSRQIVGWAMHSSLHTEVVLEALMMPSGGASLPLGCWFTRTKAPSSPVMTGRIFSKRTDC